MLVASFFAPREDKWGCDYDNLLMYVEESCKKLDLEHWVISDQIRPKPLKTAKFDLPQNLMLALLDGQRQFLSQTSDSVLLIGADCLVLDHFEPTTPQLVITTSDTFSDCRFNSGAIWCASGKICAQVWEEALKLNPKSWGDDQRCLYQAIKSSKLLVSEVDCREFNWAPESLNDDAGLPAVVHFRGKRKAFMPAWAEKYLGIKI